MALPAPAAAQDQGDVCGALGRLVAAAHERSPFASVARRLRARESVIPGYAAGYCELRAGEGLFCERSALGNPVYATWPDLATCPGVTTAEQVLMTDRPEPRGNSWARVYQAGDVWIAYGMTCLRCAGDAQSRFSIGFARPVAHNE